MTPIVDELVATYAILMTDEAEPADIKATATGDTEVTTPTSIEFLGGPSDRPVFTEYDAHVAYQLWQGKVYIFFV